MPIFAIIGGTGLCDPLAEGVGREEVVATRFGAARVELRELAGQQVIFLARHGPGHRLPPHRINYRANLAALRQLQVTNILAAATVGSMNPALPPESLALLTQFLDFTRGRASSFFDGEEGEVVHVDMSDPYCPRLRGELAEAAERIGERVGREATYVCAEGPRFETAAEIRMFRSLGGDVVGMTNVPEVALAREAGICYAAVGLVTNWAAGVAAQGLSHQEVVEVGRRNLDRVNALFAAAISLHEEKDCRCRHAPGPAS
jgi:5'-methylthioadenosine phosphorylase